MPEGEKIQLRPPTLEEGAALWECVRDVGTLDLNTPYLYLLLCDRFGDTCVVAMEGDRMVGFLTGFVPPKQPNTYFVWQIGVREEARGQGLAGRLLDDVLKRPACRTVTWLEATVSPSNEASDALFQAFARRMDARVELGVGYQADAFPVSSTHEPEPLYRIGPFQPAIDSTRPAAAASVHSTR